MTDDDDPCVIKLSNCEARTLYWWLEDSDIEYWACPLAEMRSQLNAWMRRGGGMTDCDCDDPNSSRSAALHGRPFVVEVQHAREVTA